MPRFNCEADAVEDLPVGVIAKAHIFKRHSAARHGQGRRPGLIRNFGGRIDQVEHRGHIREALANGAIHHSEHIERPEKLRQQGVDGDNVAGRKLAPRPAPNDIAHGTRHH